MPAPRIQDKDLGGQVGSDVLGGSSLAASLQEAQFEQFGKFPLRLPDDDQGYSE
jgi:hypothetical protein